MPKMDLSSDKNEAPEVLPEVKALGDLIAVGAEVECTAKNGTFTGTAVRYEGSDTLVVDINGKEYPFPLANCANVVAEEPEMVEPEIVEPEVKQEAASTVDKTKRKIPAEEERSFVQQSTAVSTAPTRALSDVHDGNPGVGGIAGDVEDSDYSWPKMNLVQGVGPLSEDWAPGTLLYEKEIPMLLPLPDAAGGPANVTDGVLRCTVVNARKQYRENLPYESDEIAEVVDTLDEVKALGGTIKWADNEPPSWNPFAQLLVLFEAPNAEIADAVGYEFEGKKYGLALYMVQKTSYPVFKAINTASQFRLKNGLHTGAWDLYAARERAGENMVWKPKIKAAGPNSPEFIEWVESIL